MARPIPRPAPVTIATCCRRLGVTFVAFTIVGRYYPRAPPRARLQRPTFLEKENAMRAAVLYGFNEPFKVESVELHDPRHGEVMVKLAASGVCHSDLSIQRGILPMVPPIIIGHEGAGVVEK